MNKNTTISLIVVILIVLGGLAYWQYNQKPVVNTNRNSNEPSVVNIDQNMNIDNINTNDNAIDTSDWLIYTNDKYEFSFEYPKDWTIYNQSDKYVSFNYSQTYLSTEFTLFVFQNPNKQSIYDFYNNIDENKKIKGNDSLMYNWYESSSNDTKSIYVGGVTATNFISPMGIMENTTVAIPKGNLMIEIRIRGVEEIEKNSKYETILNTFKFTN
ncbi:MAG: hypothetical protein Q8O32_01560 [bacterium]|nr:hypothetical protein [bacterium]